MMRPWGDGCVGLKRRGPAPQSLSRDRPFPLPPCPLAADKIGASRMTGRDAVDGTTFLRTLPGCGVDRGVRRTTGTTSPCRSIAWRRRLSSGAERRVTFWGPGPSGTRRQRRECTWTRDRRAKRSGQSTLPSAIAISSVAGAWVVKSSGNVQGVEAEGRRVGCRLVECAVEGRHQRAVQGQFHVSVARSDGLLHLGDLVRARGVPQQGGDDV
jgi:hypothetical protein